MTGHFDVVHPPSLHVPVKGEVGWACSFLVPARGLHGESLAAQADFELVQGWRSTLVACKRWKATRTGVEPLRALEAACRARKAQGGIYVAAGEVTAQAAAFAAGKSI